MTKEKLYEFLNMIDKSFVSHYICCKYHKNTHNKYHSVYLSVKACDYINNFDKRMKLIQSNATEQECWQFQYWVNEYKKGK